MNKIKVYSLFAFTWLIPVICMASRPVFNPVFAKKFAYVKSIQPLLHQQYKSVSMSKTSKVLTTYFRQNWNSKSKAFADTATKFIFKWDKSLTPTRLEQYDYQYYLTRTVSTGFVAVPSNPSARQAPYFKFNWTPSVIVYQNYDSASNKWLNTSVDSFKFNGKNEMLGVISHNYDSTNTKIIDGNRLLAYNNKNGDRIGFQMDTANASLIWGNEYQVKTDTVYNSQKKVTGLIIMVYNTTTKAWENYLSENYILDANNIPATSYRYDYNNAVTIDSFINMKWLYYSLVQTTLFEDFQNITGQPTTVVLTDGNLNSGFDHYTFDRGMGAIRYSDSRAITFRNDSLPDFIISNSFDGINADSNKEVYTYYPDKLVMNDSMDHWNGVKFQNVKTNNNFNNYDVDNYLSTQINKIIDVISNSI